MTAALSPQQRIDAIRFQCSCCRQWKVGLPALTKNLPEAIFELDEAERAKRAKIGSDLCSLDGEHFFVRAVLALPVQSTTTTFDFGVWSSLAKANYELYAREFDNPAPEFGPFFSWLCSSLPPFQPYDYLKSMLVFQPNNKRPLVNLEESDHPLAVAQRDGISVDDVERIYAAWGHTALTT